MESSEQTSRRPTRRPLSLTAMALFVGSVIAILFLALPQLALIIRGIQTRGWEGLPNAGVSEALFLSLTTTALSSGLTVAMGTPLAYILARWRFVGRRFLIVVVELPIVLPPTVAGLALLITAGRRGLFGPLLESAGITLPFTTAAVVVAQTFVSAPFFIRAAQVGFAAVPREIEDAARVDGASGLTLFRSITLPLSATALAAGLTLSWARAVGEFGATILFAGSIIGRTQTMTLLVYNVLESNLDAAVWASLILLGLAGVALLLSQWLTRHSESVE
ncbi:MAG: ABC transporter permease [Aggregatilineales bacterium]